MMFPPARLGPPYVKRSPDDEKMFLIPEERKSCIVFQRLDEGLELDLVLFFLLKHCLILALVEMFLDRRLDECVEYFRLKSVNFPTRNSELFDICLRAGVGNFRRVWWWSILSDLRHVEADPLDVTVFVKLQCPTTILLTEGSRVLFVHLIFYGACALVPDEELFETVFNIPHHVHA